MSRNDKGHQDTNLRNRNGRAGQLLFIWGKAGDEGIELKRTPTIRHELAAKHQSVSPNSVQMRAKDESEGSSLREGQTQD